MNTNPKEPLYKQENFDVETPRGMGKIIDRNQNWIHVWFSKFDHDWFIKDEIIEK